MDAFVLPSRVTAPAAATFRFLVFGLLWPGATRIELMVPIVAVLVSI
jgi:hypothetical protein